MEILEMLIANELLVASLYAVYAERFPEESAFWFQTIEEENMHAKILQGVLHIASELPSFIDENRFKKEEIQAAADLVHKALQQAKTCTLLEALTQARDIENTITESSFFEVIVGDSPLVHSAFIRIQQDTKKHREQIQEKRLRYLPR